MRRLDAVITELHLHLEPLRPLPEAEVRRALLWTDRILADLDCLHRMGIQHGAVEPCRIRVAGRRVRLDAPGGEAALEYRDPQRTRGLLREPAGRRRAKPRHDLYSLGAVLFFVLEGGPPPCGSGSAFTRPVAAAVAHVVYRALAEESSRYPTAAAMRRDVRALLRRRKGFGAVEDLPFFTGGRVRTPRPLRPFEVHVRRRRPLLAAALLLLAVLGFLQARGTVAAPEEPPGGLAGLVTEWRGRLDDRLRAAGEELGEVRLVVIDEVGVPAAIDWPPSRSHSCRRAARSVLGEGVSAGEVQAALLAAAPRERLPAVLWITPAGRGDRRVRLFYRGVAWERVLRP